MCTQILRLMPQNKSCCQSVRTVRCEADGTLASLGRGPPESDTNECSPKYLIVKVEISMALDCTLDIQLLNYMAWRYICVIYNLDAGSNGSGNKMQQYQNTFSSTIRMIETF
ncbi:unnamed protein product, partial [Brenthis ino]